jgi:hypothetical protein
MGIVNSFMRSGREHPIEAYRKRGSNFLDSGTSEGVSKSAAIPRTRRWISATISSR